MPYLSSIISCLNVRNHIDSCLVTSAKELGIQISLHDILCGLDSYDTCTERDNVRIVVFLNKMRCRDIRAYGCTHTMNFVCCNRDTNTCSADKHRTLHLTGCNCASDFLADLRIITPFRCVNTIVYNLMSKAFRYSLICIFISTAA